MAEVRNLNQLLEKLSARAAAAGASNVSVRVGYTAAYAVYVHENLEAVHTVGQAKYLEEPARRLRPVLAKTVKAAVKRGLTMVQALLLAGLQLQRDSQMLVPVDTGNLKGSAFTRQEER